MRYFCILAEKVYFLCDESLSKYIREHSHNYLITVEIIVLQTTRPHGFQCLIFDLTLIRRMDTFTSVQFRRTEPDKVVIILQSFKLLKVTRTDYNLIESFSVCANLRP